MNVVDKVSTEMQTHEKTERVFLTWTISHVEMDSHF